MLTTTLVFYPTWKLCIHFAYKNCIYKMHTTDFCKVYTKCIQNVYHISTNIYIRFVYKIKRATPAKFCIQNECKSFSKCGKHFVYKYFVYILYTSILICLKRIYIINIMYIICIQKSYKMYIQIIVCRMDPYVRHILTHLLTHFLLANHGRYLSNQ